MGTIPASEPISLYTSFAREQWTALRANTPLLLTEEEVISLRGINDMVSLQEVEEIYVPLSRLLNLHVAAVQHLYDARREFMGAPLPGKVPYIIGVAGSVAVGKSTFSRVLRAALARWPEHPRVELITTDGFLYPNRVLEERHLMRRKGFPESYDRRRLLRFLADVKAGVQNVAAPVYSHLLYDIVSGEFQTVTQPDILIVEGLNVLQTADRRQRGVSRLFASDFFDFSIYLDASDTALEQSYISRFLRLRETVFQDKASYFHRYANLTETEAVEQGLTIWREINLVNLRDNVRPTRERADLIMDKGPDHSVQRLQLRRI